ncbi:hypothetical protein F9K79_09650 [Ochrobactrum sp. Kaboul]|nr:hypothetical protein F9K79_09650 [Ochrobactrum sp. Kaboul]
MNAALPLIVSLNCGCFFRGRFLIETPECEEHRKLESLDDIDDEPAEFKFDQLSDRAKERARDNYREGYPDHDWWDSVYDDAVTIAEMMGIEIDGTARQPSIQFSGFWSQGDGASFSGRWTPLADPLASLNKVMEYAPRDKELHSLAFDLALLSEGCRDLIPDAYVRVTNSGYYSHSGSTHFDIGLPLPDNIDEDNELQVMVYEALLKARDLDFDSFEDRIKASLRGFMDWIYDQLEAEHEYLTSDQVVDEALADYNFDEDGELL